MLPCLKTDPKTNKPTLMLDASAMSLLGCKRKFFFKAMLGLGHAKKDHKMEYGTGFHKAMRLHYSGASEQECILEAVGHLNDPEIHIPENDYRNASHLMSTVLGYLKHYKVDSLKPIKINNTQMLEQRIVYPYISSPSVDIVLCGTIDMIAEMPGYGIVVVDHKTTSMMTQDSYLDSYTLSTQMIFYSYLLRLLFGDHAKDWSTIINGIFISKSGAKFARSTPIKFQEYTIDEFKAGLDNFCNLLLIDYFSCSDNEKNNYQNIFFNPNFSCCAEKFGICEFRPVCLAPPELRDMTIEGKFQRKPYNPLEFQS